MPTIIATPGAVNANSYATLVEAEAYHATRLHDEAWIGQAQAVKEQALIMATRSLDLLFEWASYSTTSAQALMWPREGILNKNEWDYIPNNEIPQGLKDATAEFAMQLITADRTLDSDIETLRISSLSAGPVSLSFMDGVTAKVVPDSVVNMIFPWWGWLRSSASYRQVQRW